MALDRLYLLFSLRLSGEATPEEEKELEDLLQEHPGERLSLEVMKGLWKGPVSGTEEAEVGRSYNRHLQRLSHQMAPGAPASEPASETALVAPLRPGRTRRILGWTAAAAAMVALAGAGVWWMRHQVPAATPSPNAISTKRGSKTRVELPDGTKVWLNGDSRLTYDAASFEHDRQVNLDGEGYFDVAKDATHPFLIHAHAVVIRVLGTVFDVRSYGDERTTRTSLFNGSVEVIVRDKHIILKPNERLTVPNERAAEAVVSENKTPLPLLAVDKVRFDGRDSVGVEAEWTRGKLAFDHEPLEDIARDIARWYDVTVTIRDERLKTEPFTATFDDESLDAVLQALSLAGGHFHYVIKKKEVVIDPQP
jgi:ferric-dicitrate binding protein FerR (iron transport regulator)